MNFPPSRKKSLCLSDCDTELVEMVIQSAQYSLQVPTAFQYKHFLKSRILRIFYCCYCNCVSHKCVAQKTASPLCFMVSFCTLAPLVSLSSSLSSTLLLPIFASRIWEEAKFWLALLPLLPPFPSFPPLCYFPFLLCATSLSSYLLLQIFVSRICGWRRLSLLNEGLEAFQTAQMQQASPLPPSLHWHIIQQAVMSLAQHRPSSRQVYRLSESYSPSLHPPLVPMCHSLCSECREYPESQHTIACTGPLSPLQLSLSCSCDSCSPLSSPSSQIHSHCHSKPQPHLLQVVFPFQSLLCKASQHSHLCHL